MRNFGHVVLMGVLAAVSLQQVSSTAAQAPARDAAAVLAEAREALGGEKRLSAVKNFIVTGRTRQVRGDNLVPIEFEIAVELPDKYVRKDEIPAQESGPTSTGFNANELIQLPVPAAPPSPSATGRAGGPATPPSPAQLEAMRKTRVDAVKQDFVRLALGMFAGSFSSYPLTFTHVGQAEAPQGKADVLEAKAPPNFTVRLFVNSQTHLPIMVSWQAPVRPAAPGRGTPPPGTPGASAAQPPASAPGGASPPQGKPALPAPAAGAATNPPPLPAPMPPTRPGPGAGAPSTQGTPPPLPTPGAVAGGPPAAGQPASPPAGAAAGQGGRSGPPPAPVEYRLYFADYRDVDGLQWPFRLRRATGTDTTEETIFDRFRINAKIDPKKFEVRK